MRRLWGVLGVNLLVWVAFANPVSALDKNLTTTIPGFQYGLFDMSPNTNGLTGRAITTDYVLKVKCRGKSAFTITGTPTEIAGGFYEIAPTNTVMVTTNYDWEDECIHWAEGAGLYAGQILFAPEKFKAASLPFVNGTLDAAEIGGTVTGTVVSSTDCANSATTFDTTLATAYAGTNGPREAGLRFTSGALVNEVRRIGGYNTNGCVSVNQAFSGTPAASDAFVVVNQ